MKKVLFFLCIFFATTTYPWFFNLPPKKPFLLMIEANGDSTHTGRTIDDSFESSITLECAHALKQAVAQQYPATKIIINRTPGETIAPLQNANFANKLDVNLYLSIHIYAQVDSKPNICIYQFSCKDTIIAKNSQLCFYSFDKIYLINRSQTNTWSNSIAQTIAQNPNFTLYGNYLLPCKPLIGIKAPAIMIELGLKKSSDWHELIGVLASAIVTIIKNE